MKSPVRLLILASSLLAAAPAAAQTPAASPLLGRWAVDVARLPADDRPRSVTFTISDAGAGRWTTRIDIVAANGGRLTTEATYSLDGTPAAVTGYPGADTVSVTTPSPDVLVMALANRGTPSSTRVFTVDAGGDSQTETVVYFRPDGTPAQRTNHFNRIE
ncbi:LuxR family transcriptional regulator [Sphingosinicella terrae]|uniref:LuxR family transcriptional regulator n=1 Tax=Sphingosinicella terrae TaxID=2172047 RepID=UPI000E0D611A|nr:LuxR family transcriptional regulator [Sphingosinicella terrae]